MPDVFLLMRYGHPDEVVAGTFYSITRDLGVRLRPVLPWVEWASIDGQVSILRLANPSPVPVEQEACHA